MEAYQWRANDLREDCQPFSHRYSGNVSKQKLNYANKRYILEHLSDQFII